MRIKNIVAMLALGSIVNIASAVPKIEQTATAGAIVDALVGQLNRFYVYPERVPAIESALRQHLAAGDYQSLEKPEELAKALTRDMQAAVKDIHLYVQYSQTPIPVTDSKPDVDQPLPPMVIDIIRSHNYGVENVDRLPFNIGYLNLSVFAPTKEGSERVAAAMAVLHDTRCLIIDLRENHGGSSDTLVTLASYFFDRRTHLDDTYWREANRTDELWSRELPESVRYGGERKIYILTSKESFSAAEDFAYSLKNLKRATVIGETTGGGAHPGDVMRLSEHFSAFIPAGRSISPITHSDWEGTGVAPNIEAKADAALNLAQGTFLKNLLTAETNLDQKASIEHRLKELGQKM